MDTVSVLTMSTRLTAVAGRLSSLFCVLERRKDFGASPTLPFFLLSGLPDILSSPIIL